MGLEVNQLVVKSLVSDKGDEGSQASQSSASGGGCCAESDSNGGGGESGEKMTALKRQYESVMSRMRER